MNPSVSEVWSAGERIEPIRSIRDTMVSDLDALGTAALRLARVLSICAIVCVLPLVRGEGSSAREYFGRNASGRAGTDGGGLGNRCKS